MSAQKLRLGGRRLLYLIAIGLGVGAVPIAPGTFGTVIAVPLYLLLRDLPALVYLGWVLALFAIGIGICRAAERHIGVHDHPAVVFDEIVGFLITMFLAPPQWAFIVAGFILFRLFDVWKPFPIRAVEHKVRGGLGTMLDDALAGMYGFAALQALAFLVLPFDRWQV